MLLALISDGDCIVLTLTRLGGKTTVFKVFDGGILIITLGQPRENSIHNFGHVNNFRLMFKHTMWKHRTSLPK